MQKHQYRMRDYAGADVFPFHMGPALVNGRFEEHAHDHAELVIVTAGTGVHVINGKPYQVGAGDVSVFNVGTTHGFEQARTLRMTNIMYSPSVLSGIGSDVAAMPGYQALFVISPSAGADYRCMMRIAGSALVVAQALIARMSHEFDHKRPGYQTAIRSLLAQLVVYLSRQYSQAGVKVAGPQSALRLADTAGFMAASFREPLTIDRLAALSGLSRRHLLRQFKQVFGTTPLQYLLDLRLRHAAELLRSTTLPVTRVAFESGFEDSNYFTRRFSARHGVSPRAYRVGREQAGALTRSTRNSSPDRCG